MKPWDRRLADLAQALANCAASYFDPETFRRNVNHFLTTSRTVTFLIQKNKTDIPDFESWYGETVLKPWNQDVIMTWAKDARNFIEKEGDLELNSQLTVTLFHSYLTEGDIRIEVGRRELIHAGVTKLIRLARKSFPTHVERDAAVKIERRWVTSSLPDWEILRALTYVYRRVRKCCAELAKHLKMEVDDSADRITGEVPDEASMAQYVKLSTGDTYVVGTEPFGDPELFPPPPEIRDVFIRPGAAPVWKSLNDAIQYYSETARATFNHFGNHVSILFIFDEHWRLALMTTIQFADQTEKYIFWRMVGDKVRTLRAHGLVWIGESWERELETTQRGPPRKGRILGEHLSVTGVDRNGHLERIVWSIKRGSEDSKPVLEEDTKGASFDGVGNFLVPALRAMGVPDSSPLMPRLRY